MSLAGTREVARPMLNSNRSHRDEFDVKMARPSTISVRFSPLDFLVKVQSGKGVISIIIEYDGFKEHFTDLEKVDAYNHTITGPMTWSGRRCSRATATDFCASTASTSAVTQ
jgi:hypothetical protein